MYSKAESVLSECLIRIGNMRIGENSKDTVFYRTQAQEIAGNIFEALGFLNQTYYKRSWGHYREQVRNLQIKPDQLEKYLDTIMFSTTSEELMSACEKLTADTLFLLSGRKNSVKKGFDLIKLN